MCVIKEQKYGANGRELGREQKVEKRQGRALWHVDKEEMSHAVLSYRNQG